MASLHMLFMQQFYFLCKILEEKFLISLQDVHKNTGNVLRKHTLQFQFMEKQNKLMTTKQSVKPSIGKYLEIVFYIETISIHICMAL